MVSVQTAPKNKQEIHVNTHKMIVEPPKVNKPSKKERKF